MEVVGTAVLGPVAGLNHFGENTIWFIITIFLMFKPYCLLRQTPNSSTFAFKSHVTHQDNNAADHSLMFQSNNIPTDCCHKKRSLYPVAAL